MCIRDRYQRRLTGFSPGMGRPNTGAAWPHARIRLKSAPGSYTYCGLSLATEGLRAAMVWDFLPTSLPITIPIQLEYATAPQPALRVCDPPSPYKPRHPENTAVYQLFEEHFDSYVRAYEERFEPRSGPLRPVVVQSVEQFLACGRLQGGFAPIRCPKCGAEHLVAFACSDRSSVAAAQLDLRWVFDWPHEGFSRHTFVGANLFMQRLLNRFRADLSRRRLTLGHAST